MGIYLNPGFTSFENTVRSEIFVDKTEMLLFLNSVVSTDQRYICVSRPRRFGKSIAANMLCAYYGKPDSRELFQKCKVSQTMDWDRYLGQFDILRILAPYTGFTEEEVKNLCVEYNMDYNEISDWYDGYLVSGSIPVVMRQKQGVDMYSGQPLSIYSPLSVVRALSTGLIMNYWNKTETYEALAEYIRMNLDGLKDAVVLMMEGGSVKVDISSYQNDMTTFTCRDDVLALLINLGYLKYNLETGEVSVPNKEILDEFKISTRSEEWVDTFKAFG